MDSGKILHWLRAEDRDQLAKLWHHADRVRRENLGDDVHLRALLEISNHCVRGCTYCGIRRGNIDLERYRLPDKSIIDAASQAAQLGYGTLVLQSGEDPENSRERISELIRVIKGETGMALTLSLGERPQQDYAAWRQAGADRYLLRFETSDPTLFQRIHPHAQGKVNDRLGMLHDLTTLGFEVGSGIMVGIPGQTYTSLVQDLEMFRELKLHMIGVGPFIPHPVTPLGRPGPNGENGRPDQVPATELMTLRVLALARLLCPQANLPSTTALATINRREGRTHGLQRGANVVMPNFTPQPWRDLYQIYPGKAGPTPGMTEIHENVLATLAELGRKVGSGRGDAPSYRKKGEPKDV